MSTFTELDTVEVCTDCANYLENNDLSGLEYFDPQRADEVREAVSTVEAGELTLGFTGECDIHYPNHELCDSDCELIDFSHSPCYVCESRLAGSRFIYTIWA